MRPGTDGDLCRCQLQSAWHGQLLERLQCAQPGSAEERVEAERHPNPIGHHDDRGGLRGCSAEGRHCRR